MNRRHFLTSVLAACAGPLILPSAMTYRRVWRPERRLAIVPFWYQTTCDSAFVSAGYLQAIHRSLVKMGRILDGPLPQKDRIKINGVWRELNSSTDIIVQRTELMPFGQL